MELNEALYQAFRKAEQETADHFGGETCSMKTVTGDQTCPICYYQGRLRAHLTEMGFKVNMPFHEPTGVA